MTLLLMLFSVMPASAEYFYPSSSCRGDCLRVVLRDSERATLMARRLGGFESDRLITPDGRRGAWSTADGSFSFNCLANAGFSFEEGCELFFKSSPQSDRIRLGRGFVQVAITEASEVAVLFSRLPHYERPGAPEAAVRQTEVRELTPSQRDRAVSIRCERGVRCDVTYTDNRILDPSCDEFFNRNVMKWPEAAGL